MIDGSAIRWFLMKLFGWISSMTSTLWVFLVTYLNCSMALSYWYYVSVWFLCLCKLRECEHFGTPKIRMKTCRKDWEWHELCPKNLPVDDLFWFAFPKWTQRTPMIFFAWNLKTLFLGKWGIAKYVEEEKLFSMLLRWIFIPATPNMKTARNRKICTSINMCLQTKIWCINMH